MMTNVWPLLLPLALISGWLVARIYKPKQKSEVNHGYPYFARDYFTGLNYLLNEQDDKAVAIFIKMLEVDSNTVETHLALGSLFRRRGEVGRAIRIHQNLIARPQLSSYQRFEALLALGRDYLTAGVFDRAERVFQQCVEADVEQADQALWYLLDIYQQEKAWDQAILIAHKIQMRTGRSMQQVIAHHYCELTEQALKEQQIGKAEQYLAKALHSDSGSVRANLLQADVNMRVGRFHDAVSAYRRIVQQHPAFVTESLKGLLTCYEKLGDIESGINFIKQLNDTHPNTAFILTLIRYLSDKQPIESVILLLENQLMKDPSLAGLIELIKLYQQKSSSTAQQAFKQLQTIAINLIEYKPAYRCEQCGFSGKILHWYCPGCKRWNTIKPIKQVGRHDEHSNLPDHYRLGSNDRG